MRKPPTLHSYNILPALAVKVAVKRREIGLTQAQLAELLDVEPDTVSRMERGLLIPSLERLLDYANVLNVSLSELLGDIPNEVSKTEQEWTALLNELCLSDKQLVLSLVKPLIKRLRGRKQ
jgi:transcriptional regulator with XRE-family HTH domain